MSAASLWIGIGLFAALPLLWSGLVALARRSVGRDALLSDAHERAVLLIMLAPVAAGCIALVAPREVALAALPPLPELFEFAGPAINAAPVLEKADTGGADWFLIAAWALILAYGLGVVRLGIPLIAAHLRVRRWVEHAHAYTPMPGLYLSERASTPLAVSRDRVLFPRPLFELLSDEEVRLIVAHERHHHARGDVIGYALLAWLDVLAWFNPFLRAQSVRCRLAAELDCDAAVTAAAPEMRRAYAQTLLVVLKHTAGNALPCAPAVFSHRAIGEHRMRILRIMKRDDQARKRAPWLAYTAALALAAPIGATQLALAQSAGGAATPVTAAAPAFSQAPLAGRISSGFGERPDPFTGQTRTHSGIDIVAEEGDPIVAPANGRVLRVLANNRGYGNMLEIDHGGGYVIRYAQLSVFEVHEGDQVSAGQLIARVGSSGRATGPHLHLEVWRDGVAVDPALVLTLSSGR